LNSIDETKIETYNPKSIYMAKNSTLYSNAPFISSMENGVSARQTGQKENDLAVNQSPSDAVIANILGFSKALKVEKSSQTGLIEMVLN
jgi:hypothetical protein